jgi:hypothetical protein
MRESMEEKKMSNEKNEVLSDEDNATLQKSAFEQIEKIYNKLSRRGKRKFRPQQFKFSNMLKKSIRKNNLKK